MPELFFVKRFLAAIIILIFGVAGLSPAMPPHPRLKDKISSKEIIYPECNRSIKSGKPPGKYSLTNKKIASLNSGSFKALCLLVDFSDNNAQIQPSFLDTLIFDNQFGTVRNYYGEISYDQIDIVTVNLPSTTGWNRAPQNYSYYVNGNYGINSAYPNNSQKLCEDLVDLADAEIDFSQYDNDGDGYVDVIMIVHSGPGAEFSGNTADIWSHKWAINPRNRDGVYISDYAVMPEYWNLPNDLTIGVFCHELAHTFGLPDLYDMDNGSYGTGKYSLMSIGCWNGYLGSSPSHPDAWSRIQLGWLMPTNIVSSQSGAIIPEVENNSVAYRLWTNGVIGEEYFLIENRQRVGYDAALPGSGLCIWHIDEGLAHNNYEWFPGHNTFGNYLVALEQADNLYQLEKLISAGDGGDQFPGTNNIHEFAPWTSPGSNSYASDNTLVSVTNISASGETMSADFSVSLASGNEQYPESDNSGLSLPDIIIEQNYPNPFNPATTIRFTLINTGNVEIKIYNVLGRIVSEYDEGIMTAGTYSFQWNGTDNSGEILPSGVYFYEFITGHTHEVRKMIFTK
ncbi:MAG: M6 family metalloprotease domain-containing protein [Candidatus Zixiibacteriota bacterium]